MTAVKEAGCAVTGTNDEIVTSIMKEPDRGIYGLV